MYNLIISYYFFRLTKYLLVYERNALYLSQNFVEEYYIINVEPLLKSIANTHFRHSTIASQRKLESVRDIQGDIVLELTSAGKIFRTKH